MALAEKFPLRSELYSRRLKANNSSLPKAASARKSPTASGAACWMTAIGARASANALRYAMTLFALQSAVWLLGVVLRQPRGWWPGARRASIGMTGGVLSMVGYIAVLWAQIRAPLGVVSALRETGVLWAALIGVFIFREGRVRRVVVPAALVVGGIALLSLG